VASIALRGSKPLFVYRCGLARALPSGFGFDSRRRPFVCPRQLDAEAVCALGHSRAAGQLTGEDDRLADANRPNLSSSSVLR
jgi:hypothetical protein